jgi:hypothetical protein
MYTQIQSSPTYSLTQKRALVFILSRHAHQAPRQSQPLARWSVAMPPQSFGLGLGMPLASHCAEITQIVCLIIFA